MYVSAHKSVRAALTQGEYLFIDNRWDQVFADKQVLHNNMLEEVNHSTLGTISQVNYIYFLFCNICKLKESHSQNNAAISRIHFKCLVKNI